MKAVDDAAGVIGSRDINDGIFEDGRGLVLAEVADIAGAVAGAISKLVVDKEDAVRDGAAAEGALKLVGSVDNASRESVFSEGMLILVVDKVDAVRAGDVAGGMLNLVVDAVDATLSKNRVDRRNSKDAWSLVTNRPSNALFILGQLGVRFT